MNKSIRLEQNKKKKNDDSFFEINAYGMKKNTDYKYSKQN